MPRGQSPFTLEYVLLGILDQQPSYGYDLYRKISQPAGVFSVWQVKQSKLYAILEKLETDGLLTSRLVPGESHPMRKEFRTTEAGRAVLLSWMEKPVTHGRDMRQDFLARFYFSLRDGKTTALKLINLQKEEILLWQKNMREQLDNTDTSDLYERMVLQFRILQIEAMQNWLDYCARELEN